MCQPKSKGGKRCSLHALGSIATIRNTTIITGVDNATVTKVFRDLRKEGSGLPTPPQSMVKEFADMQRFSTHFNPDLTEHERKIISRQWEKAAEDQPDGGTFHAWKNTLGATLEHMKNMRGKLTAIAASSVLSFSLAACGGGALSNATPSTDPSSIPTPTISQTADPTGNSQFGVELSTDTVTDSYGTYNQLTLDSDSALLKYNDAVVSPDVKTVYSEEDIQSAQILTSNFYVSEGIDSRLAYDASIAAQDQWLGENGSKFAQTEQSNLALAISNAPAELGYGVIEGNGGDWMKNYGVTPKPYALGTPRENIKSISLDKVRLAPDGSSLRFDYSSVYTRDVLLKGESKVLQMTVTQSYSLEKNPDGTWLMNGWLNQIKGDWSNN